jgi:hypothetical protein
MPAGAVVFSVWCWTCMDVGVDGLTVPARMSAGCRASMGRSACLVDGHALWAVVV